jgi:hypothetical protein
MVTIGRHVSKLSGYAPALPTLFGSPTIVAPHGSDNPNPQRRRPDGGGSGCGAHIAGSTKLPQRPSPEILSDAIPLFSSDGTRTGSGLRASAKDELAEFFCASSRLCGSPIETPSPQGAPQCFYPNASNLM